jgi:hypothetical protein
MYTVTIKSYISSFSFTLVNLPEMSVACSTYGERKGVYRVLVGVPKGKRPLGRPRRRWEDNIKMDLQEVGFEDMELDRSGLG